MEEDELLESVAVEMDPVVHGFGGVLIELVRSGEGFVLTKTASVTGNRLLSFSSGSEEAARAIFEAELAEGADHPARRNGSW
jgi:hypothetical protein